MKKIDLGQTITILANDGVIAGIGFLAYELRQNKEVLQLQVEGERRERVNSMVELVINNPDYLELMAKDESELSEIERDRLVALGFRLLLNNEDLYRDVTLGRISSEEAIRAVGSAWCREKLNFGAPLAWDTSKSRADPGFVDWMTEYVIDGECSRP